MSTVLHVKHPLFSSDFNKIIILSSFPKNIEILNFMKIRPLGAELFDADKHDKANSLFSQFCKRA